MVARRVGRAGCSRARARSPVRAALVLELGEPFFARHGPKAVFLGRWILRPAHVGVLAGRRDADAVDCRSSSGTPLGGITWAVTVGLVGYLVGDSAERVLKTFGVVGFVVGATAVLTAIVVVRLRHRRGGWR